jgi:WD40 repeat protein
MKRVSFGWLVMAMMTAVVSVALHPASSHAGAASGQGSKPELPQIQPPTEPILRIETGMHTAIIRRIGVDAACRLLVTGSEDKTARIWALPDGGTGEPKLLQILRVPIGPDNDGKINAVAFSPDGRLVAAGGWNRTGGDHRVYIFDAASGMIVRRLEQLKNVIYHLTFSSDGKYLAATIWGGEGVRIWETTDWKLVGEDKDYGGRDSYGAAFDAANRLYTVNYDGFLRRYGADFKLEAKIKTGGEQPYVVAIDPKNDWVGVGFDNGASVEIYSAKDLQRVFTADTAGRFDVYGLAWSSDGARLYAGGRGLRGSRLRIWDQEGRGKGRDVVAAQDTVMQLLPCRDSIAVSAQDPAFGLISATGQRQVWLQGSKPDMRDKVGGDFTVSEDGSKVRFGLGYGSNSPVLFDVVAGRLIDQPTAVSGLIAPDTASINVSDWRNNTAPKLNGKPLQLTRFEEARSVAIAPGSDRFVLGADWSIRAYSKDGKALWNRPVPGTVWGVNITRDGRYVIAAYGDGTIRWLHLSDGAEVLALFVNTKTREWVLWTPQGYYASSVAGDQYVGWQLNKGWEQAGEFVTAAALKTHLYRPDIIKSALQLADATQAVREAALPAFKIGDLANHIPPVFRIVDPGDKAHADKSPIAIKLALGETNDPVTGFDVKVNGRQVTPRDVRDIPQPTKAAETRSLSIPLEKGENHIQIAARNSVGDTVQDLLVYLDREGALNKKGRLLILAVGVDKYPKLGAQNSLHFAASDAGLIVETLMQRAGPLHTEVKPVLLVSGGQVSPTRANVEDALGLFREAGPEDTVVLFLAGHGVNEGADYLFLPEDAEQSIDGRWRPSSVVKWQVLQQALQDAQGSRIMFVDTCHARGAYNSRLIKDAADANIVVFSATDTETLAQETSKLGHGVFTYALSQGLNGEADLMKKGSVNILALGEYVADEVKRLTNDEQEPTFSASGVKNFVVAAH